MDERPIRAAFTSYCQPSICEETAVQRGSEPSNCLRSRSDVTRPVKRLLSIALIAAAVLGSSGAMACEKHLNGHQNSSDTNTEGTKK